MLTRWTCPRQRKRWFEISPICCQMCCHKRAHRAPYETPKKQKTLYAVCKQRSNTISCMPIRPDFVFRTLLSMNGVQEAASSNLATPTMQRSLNFLGIARELGLFLFSFSWFDPLVYPLQPETALINPSIREADCCCISSVQCP